MRVADLLAVGEHHTDAWDEAVDGADAADITAVLTLVGDDDPGVRLAIATTLPLLTHGDLPTGEMVEVAIRLSADPAAEVRDWACFALAQQWREVDTPELRDALAARLDDGHDDTRCEALVGLAYRLDSRALPHVRAALTRDEGDLWFLELVAAGALSDPQLHELVLPHVDGWGDAESDRTGDVVRRLTDPAGPGDDLLDGVADHYRRRDRSLGNADEPGGWDLMSEMLEIAPHRAHEFFGAVLARLSGDEAAERELRERSYLAQLVEKGR